MEGFFNPVSILLHMLNAAILGGALYYLLYRPVRRFMLARQETIQSKLDDAAAAARLAEESRANNELAAREAERKAAGIITDGTKIAQARAEEILLQAREEAVRTARRAKSDAEKMLIEARETMRDQAADLALKMAEKLIARDISREDHTRLINELIERL